MSSQRSSETPYSARRQRRLFLIALVVGVVGFTSVMLVVGQSLSERFTSQVEAGLQWRALRGAQELSKASALALAMNDRSLYNKTLDAYSSSSDVQAIAVEVRGNVVTSHGAVASIAPVFAAEPGTLVHGAGYLASWAPAVDKDGQANKVAVVVSTRRLAAAELMQIEVSLILVIAGVAAAVLGVLVIRWLTGRVVVPGHEVVEAAGVAVAVADSHAVADSPGVAAGAAGAAGDAVAAAAPPGGGGPGLAEGGGRPVDRNRTLRLVLDHSAQGFLTVDLHGALGSERSVVVDRWFGEPLAGATLAGYFGQHSTEFAAKLGVLLQSVAAGVTPLAKALVQLPKRLSAAGKFFDIKYVPVMRGDKPEGVLLIISDITEQVGRERALQAQREQREQKELAALAELITGNRSEFDEFFAEAASLVAAFAAPAEPETERGTLHTLKEHCAYYGLETYVELCQGIEATLAEAPGPMTDEQRVAVSEGWGRFASQLTLQLAGDSHSEAGDGSSA